MVRGVADADVEIRQLGLAKVANHDVELALFRSAHAGAQMSNASAIAQTFSSRANEQSLGLPISFKKWPLPRSTKIREPQHGAAAGSALEHCMFALVSSIFPVRALSQV